MKNAKHIAGLMLSIPFEEYLQEKTSVNIQKPMISLFGGVAIYTCTPVLIRVTENMSKIT